jgi:chemotaxis protein CheZ
MSTNISANISANSALLISENTRDFLASLEAGDTEQALQFLEKINREKDHTIFQQIGKMTRTVHDTIVNFHIESTGKTDASSEKISKMVDASDRLQFVIKTTENAANKTMDMIEASLPITQSLGDTANTLQTQWQQFFKDHHQLDPELFKQVDQFFLKTKEDTHFLENNLTQILMAQDFQDITGQVLKKVIALVRDVEENLVELVKIAAGLQFPEHKVGKPNKVLSEDSSHAALEGPVMDKTRTDVVTNQDDVDDLLSSLGF